MNNEHDISYYSKNGSNRKHFSKENYEAYAITEIIVTLLAQQRGFTVRWNPGADNPKTKKDYKKSDFIFERTTSDGTVETFYVEIEAKDGISANGGKWAKIFATMHVAHRKSGIDQMDLHMMCVINEQGEYTEVWVTPKWMFDDADEIYGALGLLDDWVGYNKVVSKMVSCGKRGKRKERTEENFYSIALIGVRRFKISIPISKKADAAWIEEHQDQIEFVESDWADVMAENKWEKKYPNLSQKLTEEESKAVNEQIKNIRGYQEPAIPEPA